MFKAAAEPPPPTRDFTPQTMAAVAAAAERDARRQRRLRSGVVVGGVASAAATAYFASGYLAAALSSIFVVLIDLLIVGVVHVAGAMQSGIDAWSVAATVGRAAAALAGDARVAVALVVIQGIAIAAFVVLRRLLGSDLELLK